MRFRHGMKGELLYVHHPHRTRIKWGIFWLSFMVATFVGLYFVAAHIRTHSLPVGQLELSVPYTKYVLGEEVTFSLTNSFNTTVFVSNECPSEPLMVYKKENLQWVRTHDVATKADCPNESRTIAIPSNGVITGSFAKWKNLFAKPGKYRIVAYVEYYNALPYADIEIVDKSTGATGPRVASSTPVLSAKSKANTAPSTTVPSWNSSVAPAPAGATNTTSPPTGGSTAIPPKTVTISVNSAGRYSSTYVVLNAGDTLKIVYSPVGGNEVKTSFSPFGGTATPISTITVDHERQSASRVLNLKGSWHFSAAPDITGGDVGTLVVQ